VPARLTHAFAGELAGFPCEVVDRMLECQQEQGNPASVRAFELDTTAAGYEGGFRWADSAEGQDFWQEVIDERNFDLFFERYPQGRKPPRKRPGKARWKRHFARTM
jgi:hypothetical protein